MCPIGTVFDAALPKSLLIRSETVIKLKNDSSHDSLSEKSIHLLEVINQNQEILVKDLSRIFGNSILKARPKAVIAAKAKTTVNQVPRINKGLNK